MKVRQILKALENKNPEADVLMHGQMGNPLLFVTSYVNDDTKIVLEDADDVDMRTQLMANFETVTAGGCEDEAAFFKELADTGFTLDDIKLYVPEKYEYAKKFM